MFHPDFLALCEPKPGNTEAKVKPKNQRSTFLLGDNLKQAAKDDWRSQKLTKKECKKQFKGIKQTQARNQTKSFLGYGINEIHIIPKGGNTTTRGIYV